jgi:hypothetical protein
MRLAPLSTANLITLVSCGGARSGLTQLPHIRCFGGFQSATVQALQKAWKSLPCLPKWVPARTPLPFAYHLQHQMACPPIQFSTNAPSDYFFAAIQISIFLSSAAMGCAPAMNNCVWNALRSVCPQSRPRLCLRWRNAPDLTAYHSDTGENRRCRCTYACSAHTDRL